MARKYLVGLLALAVGGVAVTLMSEPVLVEPTDELVEARLLADLGAALTAVDLNDRVARLLEADRPEDAESYIALAQRLEHPLAPEVIARYGEATSTAATLLRYGKRGFYGFVTGEADDAASFAGSTISDFMVFGDARDLAIQAGSYVQGKEVDEWVLGLSVVGLGMSAATMATGGAAAPAKTGFSVLKTAKRTGKLTAGLDGVLRGTILAAADLPGLRRRLADLDWRSPLKAIDGIKAHAAAVDLGPTRNLLSRFGAIADRTSPADTLRIIRHVDSADELAQAERVSRRFGKGTAAAFETLGKRAFKAFGAVAKMTAVAFWALVTAILSLAMTIITWISLGLLGFLARRLRRPTAAKAPSLLPAEEATS